MFDAFGVGPPEGWEPIPDEVFDELGAWGDEDEAPAGTAPFAAGPDAFVWEALGRSLGVQTMPLLLAVDIDLLSAEGRSRALGRAEELTAHLEAFKARLTAAIAGPAPADEAARRDDFSPQEISVATKSSVYAADTKINVARQLATNFQATAAALEAGTISYPQVRSMIDGLAHCDPALRAELEANLLKFSHRQTLTLFNASVRRWREKKDPAFTKRATARRREVSVSHIAVGDGVGELLIRGPLELTVQLSMVLTAHAAKTRGELGGTVDQRKLAALRDMTDRYLADPTAARQHGRLPTVNITIDLATLLNLRAGVAEIPGVGTIPASVAQWLLADGAPFRRLITDPEDGRLLDYGRNTYPVPPALADYLCAVNIHSATPHSSVPAAGCDMEHNLPHDHGGATDPINTTPVERRWHRAKTHGDWTYQKHPDTRIVTWTSPTGLTCDIHPYDYRPDW